jgi:hypothetical protein
MGHAVWVLALVGCASKEQWQPVGLPASAEGVVLLAEISSSSIRVQGVLDGVPQVVDLDQVEDDRYGFRYRVRDADGALLYESSTTGPALVQAFLEYYSGESGVDILDSVPALGRFPVVVPLLPEADSVDFEVRSAETGEYELRGRWGYDALQDPRIEPDPALQADAHWLAGEGGENRLDLVVLSDGYRAQDLEQYAQDVELVKDKLLKAEPFASYADRLNVVRLDIPSVEAGASFDCPTCGVVDNTFGSIFALELINQIMGSNYSSRALFQSEQWKLAEALSFHEWDVALVMVNSEKFGGMAVHHATVTRGVGDIGDTAVHELGHSFGMLGDEYVADACIRSPRVGIPENITDRPKHPPWEHLLDPDAPLPTPPGSDFAVGAYEGAWNCPDLYRPEEHCRMNDHGPFCEVCQELLSRRLLRFVDPAEGVHLEGRDVIITGPLPDTTVTLVVDGEVVAEGPATEPPRLPRKGSEVEVRLTHLSPFVGSDPQGDLTQSWYFSR